MRARQKQPDLRTPAEKKEWKEIRATLKRKRRAERIKAKESLPAPIVYSPSGDGLKRGPKKDTTRDDADKCSKTCSCAMTPNEYAVLEKFRTSLPFPPTFSQFMRVLATERLFHGAFHGGVRVLAPQVADRLWSDPDVQRLRGVVESRDS